MALDCSIIGKRLKEARIEKQMTQEDLAEKMNVSIAFISKIERGKSRINLNRLEQFCCYLDVNEGYILTGTSSKSDIYLEKEFSNLLKSCSPEKQKLIYNVAKAIQETK